MRRLGMLVLLALAAGAGAGCGGDDGAVTEPRAGAARTPATQPPAAAGASAAAWRLEAADLGELARGGDALATARRGQVVARTGPWDGYPAVVLLEWLDRRGVPLDPSPRARRVIERVADDQEVSLLVFGPEHRRHAAALAALHPAARTLRRFARRFTGDDDPLAGRAMLAWLDVFRKSIAATDARHVVVVPVLD